MLMDQVSKNDEIHRLRSRFIPQGHTSRQPRYVVSASGAIIHDVEGREYIGIPGGIGVMSVGHSHPRVIAAIQDQAAKFTHTCFMVLPYESAVSLAEKLCAVAPVSFSHSRYVSGIHFAYVLGGSSLSNIWRNHYG